MYMFEGHKGSTTLQGFRLLCSDFSRICIWNAQVHFQRLVICCRSNSANGE